MQKSPSDPRQLPQPLPDTLAAHDGISFGLQDVYGHVARVLVELADEENGVLLVRERLGQQDITDRGGASREAISRIMKDLTHGGYVTTVGRQMVLLKKLPADW
ncbi:MAG: helix-turn-helix domain-containing protein [Betaproteobacteria bacterium]